MLPGSHTSESDSSACLLYSPTVCRKGGVGNQTCKDHDVSLGPNPQVGIQGSSSEAVRWRHTSRGTRTYGSSIVALNLLEVPVL